MSIEAWSTLAIILLCFGMMALTRYPPDAILMSGLTLLLLGGILTPEQALSGLANQGMVAVGVLYIVATGIRETGAISWFVHNILGRPKSLNSAQLRLMLPVAVVSAFMNNTPVVAVMIPAVKDWARRNQLQVSKLMIPLSYAAIVGGTCTLIGTSTNLVVNGLLIDETGTEGLALFEIAWIGIPTVIAVLTFTMLLGRWLLPEGAKTSTQFDDARGYTVEMIVESDNNLVGRTIEDAGLRHLPGLYLMEIDRGGQVLPAVSPKEHLQANDRLVFVGVVESVVDLQKIRGLKPATDQVFKLNAPRPERCLIEAVISDSFPLAGMSIRESRFRSFYNAAIIAVARNGTQIKKKIGDITLKPGDTLLLETQSSFVAQQKNSRDFYLISELADSSPPRHERAMISFLILVAMVVSVALGWLTILKASMLAAGLMIVTRCTTAGNARRSVDWQVLIVIAASLGIGQAIVVTGAAGEIATTLLDLTMGQPWLALFIIYLVTSIFTSMISNTAAAVLMFPIALATSQGLEVNFIPFVIAIMMAASASFATPIGYQTNLMVFGPGGYHFSDYLKLGIPLTLISGLLAVVLIPMIWVF